MILPPADVEEQLGSGAYAQRGISLVRGEGVKVWDSDGREYIDCISGHGAAVLGHAHPAISEALATQSERLITCSNSFSNDVRADALRRLTDVLSAGTQEAFDSVFLTNSGTEAVEAALKIARYQTGRPGLIAMKGGFHGRTLGSLSLTWRKKYREPFQPLIPEVTHIPMNNSEAASEAIDDNTAAVVVEPIQGESGVIPADPEFLGALRSLCRERGARLVFDEVQTGFGRTGNWFAFQGYDVVPDIISLAKGIAGGVPMGATAIRSGLDKLSPGSHGSTFGGNPLASAASLATMDVLERENLVSRANELGEYTQQFLQGRLDDSRMIRDIRVQGLMIGIELRRRVTPVLKELMDRGILALPAGSTVLRLLPPLIIRKAELHSVLEHIVDILKSRPVGESTSASQSENGGK